MQKYTLSTHWLVQISIHMWLSMAHFAWMFLTWTNYPVVDRSSKLLMFWFWRIAHVWLFDSIQSKHEFIIFFQLLFSIFVCWLAVISVDAIEWKQRFWFSMHVTWQYMQYTVFDQLKQRLLKRQPSNKMELATKDSSPEALSAFSAFVLGALSKSIATFLTYPAIRLVNFMSCVHVAFYSTRNNMTFFHRMTIDIHHEP